LFAGTALRIALEISRRATKAGHWPDVIVAAIMAGLALQGAWVVLHHSRAELHISTSPAQ
jgi:hypothetical protein